jgi:hypothetical protein
MVKFCAANGVNCWIHDGGRTVAFWVVFDVNVTGGAQRRWSIGGCAKRCTNRVQVVSFPSKWTQIHRALTMPLNEFTVQNALNQYGEIDQRVA